jgi:hypothetical protein
MGQLHTKITCNELDWRQAPICAQSNQLLNSKITYNLVDDTLDLEREQLTKLKTLKLGKTCIQTDVLPVDPLSECLANDAYLQVADETQNFIAFIQAPDR